jgi:hypothetical protein
MKVCTDCCLTLWYTFYRATCKHAKYRKKKVERNERREKQTILKRKKKKKKTRLKVKEKHG